MMTTMDESLPTYAETVAWCADQRADMDVYDDDADADDICICLDCELGYSEACACPAHDA